jgi:hypothetical protein
VSDSQNGAQQVLPADVLKEAPQDIEELQTDLDQWLKQYNEERPQQGRWCYGKTPMQTFIYSIFLAKEKILAAWVRVKQ